jgi:hypothetical protein
MPISLNEALETHEQVSQKNKEKFLAEVNQMVSEFCQEIDEKITLNIHDLLKRPLSFDTHVLLNHTAMKIIKGLYTDFDFEFPHPHRVSVKLQAKNWDWGGYKS